MSIENKNFIKLEFTGKIKETGDVFDTTSEEIATETGIFVENKNYGPIPIVVGGGHLLKAIDEAVIGMEKGDKKTVDIEPIDGFGERDPKLVQLLPMKEFKKQGIKPYPGMKLSLQGQEVKVQSVSGGRVRVDMNHDLAGKNLVYDIEIVDIIEDDIDKVKSLIELHYPVKNLDIDKTIINIEDGIVKIQLDEMAKFEQSPYMDITFARFRVSKDIWDNLDVSKVEFVDAFEKKEETEEEKEENIETEE